MRLNLNARRGFYRIWSLISALWVLGWVAFLVTEQPYVPDKYYVLPSADALFRSDVEISDARELEKITTKINFPNHVVLFASTKIDRAALDRRSAEFSKLYVEPRAGEITGLKLNLFLVSSLWIFAGPLVLIILGFSVLWAVEGFKAD